MPEERFENGLGPPEYAKPSRAIHGAGGVRIGIKVGACRRICV